MKVMTFINAKENNIFFWKFMLQFSFKVMHFRLRNDTSILIDTVSKIELGLYSLCYTCMTGMIYYLQGVMFLYVFICLSLCVQDYSKTKENILMIFFILIGPEPKRNDKIWGKYFHHILATKES